MRRKSRWKILCGFLCLFLTVLLALPAAAAGDSLTINYQSGITFSLYRVADMEKTLVGSFKTCGISIPSDNSTAEEQQHAAQKFKNYVNQHGISADRTGTTYNGRVTFSNLDAGYYLLLGAPKTINGMRYEPIPVLVKVSGSETVEVKGDETVVTPPGSSSEPTIPGTPGNPGTLGGGTPGTPGNPNGGGTLPQTGQLWWLVPVLLCAGVVLIVVGMFENHHVKRAGWDDA